VKSERSEVIDLFKALACLLIVLHHLAVYSPMSDIAYELAPAVEDFLFEHGLLAVQVFLVVGGYLNAKSWVKILSHAQFQFLPRLFARYQRLVIPLLAALTFTVLVSAIIRPYFDHSSLSAAPTALQVVAHVLLLQDVLYLEAFSAGVWYVAIDFQLFALALGCAWVAHRWQGISGRGSVVRKAMFFWLLLTLGSLFIWNLNPFGEIWGSYFFCAYGLGLCVGCWRYADFKISHQSLGLLIFFTGALAMAYQPRIRLLLALVTAMLLAFYEATNCQKIPKLEARWIQILSSASYGIFLTHFGVSIAVSALVFNFWSENIVVNVLGLLLSLALSIVLGWQLYRHIENQVPSWKRLMQWTSTFVLACTAVMVFS
jgi:peptidoglycan/LPS O-acetylase OafA/YrhL